MRGERADGWWVVAPVKPLGLAKSRLGLAGERRAELALAFAVDTVGAALRATAVAGVLVVTDDPRAAAALGRLGAVVTPDEPDSGLNPALAHGAALAARQWGARGVAALSADLPALRPAELDLALARAARWSRAYLPDAQDEGTTLLTAAGGAALDPRFGADSRRAHAASGAAPLPLDGVASLRRDVDTRADLRAALRLGVGAATAAAVVALGWTPTSAPDGSAAGPASR